jgi:hypothetical protein
MGLTVLLLALVQGGPGTALAAIGRGVGVVKIPTPTPYSDILPVWQVPGAAPTATPQAARSSRAGAVPTATPQAARSSRAGAAPTATPSPTPTPDPLAYSRITTWSFPDEPRIEAMRAMIVNTLKERELTFAGASGKVLSFYPGEGYNKLWGRDLSTMLPTVQYLYGDEYLRTGIEELLIRQYGPQTRSDDGDNGVTPGDGALPCDVAPDGKLDKTTVTSDEETTVIHAAYLYYKATGGIAWLGKNLGGQVVLTRLNAALDWLYANRLDPARRLIKRGHSTDWGDVKFERALHPTDFDPRTDHWTASIYDQALAYRALRELAEMNQAVGQETRAKDMLARADDLRLAANKWLWMPERGYYRLHMHITALTHSGFSEDSMVSIGNAIAIYCGLTTEEQERSIVKKLEEARLAAGARKPGVSIYPAYPTGFFATVQRNRGEYQNGGVWDWWGGVQVSAEFQRGHSDLALAHLYQIADDWARHPNVIWEWSLPSADQGRGSKGYAAAAGTVGEAIISGLYGVSISRDGLRLEPRLGTHNGEVHVYQPATDRYAAYRYTYSADAITLRYGTNVTGEATIRLLIPAGRAAQSVRIGERNITPRREAVGNDVYVVFRAPSGVNTITVALTTAATAAARPAIDPVFFDYYQANDGQRLLGAPLTLGVLEDSRRVQYFEKGKLEDHRATSTDPIWQYSYGLMAEELLRAGPALPVGGDTSTLTYADLQKAADSSKRVAAPKGLTSGVYKNKDGTVFIPFTADLKAAPGHNVAAIFWIVLSSDTRSPGGWLHDIGLPLTEPVWATVDKGALKGRRVLVQAFQRTILTYDPQNTPGWQVERANLGADYLKVFPDRGKP